MYGRGGLDRFKKAQSLEPFSVSLNSSSPKTAPKAGQVEQHSHIQNAVAQPQQEEDVQSKPATQVGAGQSTWQPPDWAIEPRPGVYYLQVVKEGQVLETINIDKRRLIFGRQYHTCDFVLNHLSVSRQHAAIVPHKNGSIYVIDLGSAHGTFVANERLTKDTPVELEVGQSLRFAASTRTYILRKNNAALFPRPPPPTEINLPPRPDPSDEEAVVAYNTLINRYGLSKSDLLPKSISLAESEDSTLPERATKRMRKLKVTFRDQAGGELVEVVGISDGADVETETGPIGVKEGSLVGKYGSLVQTTVIPKGKDVSSVKEDGVSEKGVTDKLQELLNKVKNTPKGGIYDDLYGESLSEKVGSSSWAYTCDSAPTGDDVVGGASSGKPGTKSASYDDSEGGLPQALRAFARLLCCNSSQELSDLALEAAQIDGRLARRPLKDSRREFKAHKMLSSHITQLMHKYDTAIKSLPLNSPSMSNTFTLRRQMAHDLLTGELRVLKSASMWLNNYCAALKSTSNCWSQWKNRI